MKKLIVTLGLISVLGLVGCNTSSEVNDINTSTSSTQENNVEKVISHQDRLDMLEEEDSNHPFVDTRYWDINDYYLISMIASGDTIKDIPLKDLKTLPYLRIKASEIYVGDGIGVDDTFYYSLFLSESNLDDMVDSFKTGGGIINEDGDLIVLNSDGIYNYLLVIEADTLILHCYIGYSDIWDILREVYY